MLRSQSLIDGKWCVKDDEKTSRNFDDDEMEMRRAECANQLIWGALIVCGVCYDIKHKQGAFSWASAFEMVNRNRYRSDKSF